MNRWGLAWTFICQSILDLTKAPVIRENNRSIKESKSKPIEISIPAESEYKCIEDLTKFFDKIANQLKVTFISSVLIQEFRRF